MNPVSPPATAPLFSMPLSENCSVTLPPTHEMDEGEGRSRGEFEGMQRGMHQNASTVRDGTCSHLPRCQLWDVLCCSLSVDLHKVDVCKQG